MRKIDYQILADIIQAHHAQYLRLNAIECAAACEAIAKNFANRASVNRAEFLRACGIE